jgi:hypothetical protein
MRLIRTLDGVKEVLLIGIGGGGDIVSTLPIGMMLKDLGIDSVYGGVVWERFRRDPKPGPRAVEELERIRYISDSICWIDDKTRIVTENGAIQPIVASVAGFLKERVVGVDITKGDVTLLNDLKKFVDQNEIDLIIGVDAGGDALARGDEKGLTSPLADSIMISVLRDIPSLIAVTGFGSDGELKREEIEKYMSEITAEGGLVGCTAITRDIAGKLHDFVQGIETESSKVPIVSALGYYGEYSIWDGNRIMISALNSLVFYFMTEVIYSLSPLPKVVRGSRNIMEANKKLNDIGVKTELDLEIELKELSTT